MPAAPERIELKFADCDAVIAHARALLESGYTSRGQWTLGQACSHVADWMRYPLDGFPKPPFLVRLMMTAMKYTVAPGMKRRILAEGFKPGIPTAPESVPAPGEMSDEDGIEKLQQTCERVASYEGKLHPSPLFGPMDKDTLQTVTLLHAEHHFGYLEPAQTQSQPAPAAAT